MNTNEKALKLHQTYQGKIATKIKVPVDKPEDLTLAYTPGVAAPCLAINENKENSYVYTNRGNSVAVISDGSAVLGLGNIGPEAAMPVMEGKALLLKKFADIDAIAIVLDTQDSEEIIKTVKYLAPTFGAINLEDISAPKCVEIERRLINELNIPIFHDDQHGTAIVVTAALINAAKLVKKEIKDLTVAISGTGAAGSSIMRMLKRLGVKTIYGYNSKGVVDIKNYDKYNFLIKELLDDGVISTPVNHDNTLKSIMVDADVFIGVSAPNLVDKEMVSLMNKDSIIFALANPLPEILPDEAKLGGARVIGTGRSDFPNQINNLLAFPGIFKGALMAKATKITEEMKLEAAYAIASLINDDELSEDYIVPSTFDDRVVKAVSEAVRKVAIESNVIRK
ncbi:TPA: NADP-dependent malic enzyme [bacterium]|jgi:malate dehydrogenase (oxaloacetate-decarboxylating)|nr:NADP-dependent malic enzyme [bacterium]